MIYNRILSFMHLTYCKHGNTPFCQRQSSNLTSQDEFGAEVLLWLGFALSLGLALLQWLLATFFYIAVKLLTSKHF